MGVGTLKWRGMIIAGIALVFFSYASVAVAAEIINDFHADIAIRQDGSARVVETIAYDFNADERHGIFRDIPLTTDQGPRLSIRLVDVRDEYGNSIRATTSADRAMFHVKIGDPNVTVRGAHTYVITYDVANVVRPFDDHDELYWNVTGNAWPVGITHATASVTLPNTTPVSGIRMDCFTGALRSAARQCSFDAQALSYTTTQALAVSEGLTIVFGMPLGIIDHALLAKTTERQRSPWQDNPFFVIAPVFLLIALVFGIKIYFQFWRKPKPVIPWKFRHAPVVTAYTPPDGLPPIEIGALLDRRVDPTDISSVIMDLAVRGYLKIRYIIHEIPLLPDKKDFELIKLKERADLTNAADRLVFDLLFDGRASMLLSNAKTRGSEFQRTVKSVRKETEQHLHDNGYFDASAKERAKKINAVIGVMTAVAMVFFIILGKLSAPSAVVIFIAALLVGGILSWVSFRLEHRLTQKGLATLMQIVGFRDFLQMTEEDRLRILNAPALEPEMFEKFLPYAMVLGVEGAWAKTFASLYTIPPSWYESPAGAGFNSVIFTQQLHIFNTGFNQSIKATRPHSSGFSGGFSGGGSGGGGGGSW